MAYNDSQPRYQTVNSIKFPWNPIKFHEISWNPFKFPRNPIPMVGKKRHVNRSRKIHCASDSISPRNPWRRSQASWGSKPCSRSLMHLAPGSQLNATAGFLGIFTAELPFTDKPMSVYVHVMVGFSESVKVWDLKGHRFHRGRKKWPILGGSSHLVNGE